MSRNDKNLVRGWLESQAAFDARKLVAEKAEAEKTAAAKAAKKAAYEKVVESMLAESNREQDVRHMTRHFSGTKMIFDKSGELIAESSRERLVPLAAEKSSHGMFFPVKNGVIAGCGAAVITRLKDELTNAHSVALANKQREKFWSENGERQRNIVEGKKPHVFRKPVQDPTAVVLETPIELRK